jgi:uncharacterized protein DUF5658
MSRASRIAILLVLLPTAAPGVPSRLSVLPLAFADEPCPAPNGATACSSRPALLVPLYAGFVVLQALDVHSSVTAVERGGRETNPLLAPLVDRPAAFVALKVGATAGAIFAAEKVRRRSRIGAILLMAALDSAYATIVAHNYRLTQRLR